MSHFRVLGTILTLHLTMVATAGAGTPGPTIKDQLRLAIKAIESSVNYANWMRSGATPEDTFRGIMAVDTPDARRDLCRSLSALKDDELAIFEHEITKAQSLRKISCLTKLRSRIDDYWSRAAAGFSADAGDRYGLAELEQAVPKLVSEERVIEPHKGPVLVDGGLKQGEIALTFDDGPHPTRTRRLLNILEQSGVRATFFEIGQSVRQHSEITKEVVSKGHVVGSHSWDHPHLPKLSLKKAEHNILFGHDAVMSVAGESAFFRFPYGARTKSLQSFVQNLGIATFFWNMDTLDWKLRDPARLLENVLKEVDREKGGILLFHDIQEQTVIVMPKVLDALKQRGFKTIVFIPQLQPTKP